MSALSFSFSSTVRTMVSKHHLRYSDVFSILYDIAMGYSYNTIKDSSGQDRACGAFTLIWLIRSLMVRYSFCTALSEWSSTWNTHSL
jgi:hypothetical protein